jgi:hypothetical protein
MHALVLGTFAKPLLLLMMIWKFPFPLHLWVDLFTLVSTIVSLHVMLNRSVVLTIAIAACGLVCRILFQSVVYSLLLNQPDPLLALL